MLLTTAAEISPATQETISTTVALSQTTESIGNFTKTTGGPITVTEACLFNVQVRSRQLDIQDDTTKVT